MFTCFKSHNPVSMGFSPAKAWSLVRLVSTVSLLGAKSRKLEGKSIRLHVPWHSMAKPFSNHGLSRMAFWSLVAERKLKKLKFWEILPITTGQLSSMDSSLL